MTPEFALDLSPDGITLLRRADDGWRRVGAVALDADQLVDDLAALREKAGGDLATKLIIPNGQILYTSCPASGKDALADEVRVRAALVGATPYEVADLVFDWESDGETLQIAVVARETLQEARAFAGEHGFGPVGYVAVPPRGAFLREPFFGPVDRGPEAAPAMLAEAEPVEIVGDWDAPNEAARTETVTEAGLPAAAEMAADQAGMIEGLADTAVAEEAPLAPESTAQANEPEPVTDPVPGADDTPKKVGASQQAVPDAVAPGAETTEPEQPPEGAEAPPPVAPEEGPAKTGAAVEAEADLHVSDGAAVAAEAKPESTTETPPESDDAAQAADSPEPEAEGAVAMAPFSSIRATSSEGRSPRLGGARDAKDAVPTRKLGGAKRGETPASPPPKPVAKAPAPTEAPAPAARAVPEAEGSALAGSVAADPSPSATSAPAPATTADPEADLQDGPQDANGRDKAAFATFRERVAMLRRPAEKGALTPEIIAAPLPRPEPKDLPERSSQEAQAGDFTIFGARGKTSPKARKGFPLALTVALLLFMAMVGLWSKLFLANDATTVQDSPAVSEQTMSSASSLPGGDDGALTRSITFAETGTSGATTEPEGETDLAEALQAPATPAPSAENTPVDLASLSDDPFSALPEEAPQIAEPMLEIPPLPEIDADAEAADDSELADAEPEPEAAPATPMTPEQARTAYAESGVWQQAPEPANLPAEESTDDIYIASIDPEVRPYDAVALPRAEADGGSDAALPRQPSPMPPGQEVEFAADGSIVPTRDGVVTAEGITLYAGRPHVVPRARTGSTDAAMAETEAEPEAETATDEAATQLATAHPKARPEGLVEGNEKAQLGGRTRAEMAGLRPRQRPQSVQDRAETARQAAIEEAVRSSADEAAEIAQDESRAEVEAKARAEAELRSASTLAVARSRAPANKPHGFERKVAAARKQAEAARAKAAAAAAERDKEPAAVATASARVLPRNQKVAPPVPSSASVAKAATERNALRLRAINLIGVFGSPSQRRALVRLPSGRLIKVKAGDRLDGGKVAAIGQNELRYVKRGKNITLAMPKG